MNLEGKQVWPYHCNREAPACGLLGKLNQGLPQSQWHISVRLNGICYGSLGSGKQYAEQ